MGVVEGGPKGPEGSNNRTKELGEYASSLVLAGEELYDEWYNEVGPTD